MTDAPDPTATPTGDGQAADVSPPAGPAAAPPADDTVNLANPFEVFAAIARAVTTAIIDIGDGICTAFGLPTSTERRVLDEHFRQYVEIDLSKFRAVPGTTSLSSLRSRPSPSTKDPGKGEKECTPPTP